MDLVDKIVMQWKAARPDLDTVTVGPIGRLTRVCKKMVAVEEANFARLGLNMAGFDVLSALRRAAPPHALSPGELMASMMITSGTMTNRIDQLEKAALVTRSTDPADARKSIVGLTPEGLALIDQAIVDHLATQQSLLAGMSADEMDQLDRLLRKLSVSVGL